jgi:predicted  nucleic acid-binding Zn-ribbon protein
MIAVRMACGHLLKLTDGVMLPACPSCGETRVARVSAPPPKFRGVVLGPCAEYVELPAKRVELKEKVS